MIPITFESLLVFSLAVGGLTSLLVWLLEFHETGQGYSLIPNSPADREIRALVAGRIARRFRRSRLRSRGSDEQVTRKWERP